VTPNGNTNLTESYTWSAFLGLNSETAPNNATSSVAYDGLGRTIKVETGDGTGTKSVVETEYASCACSPLGKVKRVSQPYAPGGTVYWTTNAWDCTGRTTSVTHPDGSVTTSSCTHVTIKSKGF
jgi:YD repeat-containing protein